MRESQWLSLTPLNDWPMSIYEEFVKTLLCPYCKNDIDWDEIGKILYCKICKRKYPIINGIFKMVLNEDGGSDLNG